MPANDHNFVYSWAETAANLVPLTVDNLARILAVIEFQLWSAWPLLSIFGLPPKHVAQCVSFQILEIVEVVSVYQLIYGRAE
ncbi:hypothetical protein [Actinomadura sp. 3N508]|uniref:hypothetical protein n=1 Tax=Actinomadura sp. 3N508 TaxID=3375153 RepID=UPI0037BC8B98